MKNKENLIKEQLLNINLPSSNLQERVFAEIRKQNGEKKNIDNKNNEQTKEDNVEKDYKNSIKTSEKTSWYTYLSVAAVICVIAGTTFAFSKMDRSNNRGGDETTVTTVTSETSETTSVVTTVTEDNDIVTSIEETQTSNQQKIYEDGEKYSWFKQPIYDFDDVEPIVNDATYIRDKIEYSEAFRVKKGDKYGLIDSEGNVKIEIIYDELLSSLCRETKGYDLIINEEINTIDFEYKPAVKFIGAPNGLEFCWDIKENKTIELWSAPGYVWKKYIEDDKIYVVEYIEKKPSATENKDGEWEWDSHLKLGQFALCKDNKLITNEVYTSVTDLVDNCVAFEKDGKWGYLNEKGEQILPFQFDGAEGNIMENTYSDKIYPFICTEGIIAAFKDGQCGYYDNKGNVIVEMGVFEDITPVKDGKAFVKKDGKWGIIKINS